MRTLVMALVLAACAAVAGCSMPSKADRALLAQQSAPYRQRGTSAIAGRAYLIAADGRELPASMVEIHATPATSWAESRIQELLASNEIPDADDRAAVVWWTERADAAGRFSFGELAAGNYFVLCLIPYATADGAAERLALARVAVGPGQKADVAVSRRITE